MTAMPDTGLARHDGSSITVVSDTCATCAPDPAVTPCCAPLSVYVSSDGSPGVIFSSTSTVHDDCPSAAPWLTVTSCPAYATVWCPDDVVTLTPIASDTDKLPSETPTPNIMPSVAMSLAAQLPDTATCPLPTPPSGSGHAVPNVTDAMPLHG